MKKMFFFLMHFYFSIVNKINLIRKGVVYGKRLSINGVISLHGNGKIHLGNDITIHSSPNFNPTAGGYQTFIQVEEPGILKIGNNVGLSHVVIKVFKSVIIEDNVRIGSCVKIWDSDFHSIYYEDRILSDDINAISDSILIKEGAFIGACSIILKGVTVGKHSVIGAGSVVTKDIPDNEVWAGNPAKKIRILDYR